MRVRVVVPTLLIAAAPVFLSAQGPTIDHAAVGCVVAERFPRFEARLDPPGSVARALVHFRSAEGQAWYAVAMKPEGPGFSAVLPKPKKSLKSFQYYIDVTDTAFASSRTAEHGVEVVAGPAACQGKMMTGTVGSASILLVVPSGAPAVPAGFGSAGLAAAGAGTVAAAGAGAAAGGGIGAGTVAAIVGGGAAVAGAAVAVSAAGSGDEGGQDGSDGPPAPGAFYSVNFLPSPPGIDVSACAGRPLTWSSQSTGPKGTGGLGAFDDTWSPMDPNTVRVTGTVTETSFNATIACTNGAASGTLSATGSGGNYQGTFTFGSQRGSITVQRRTQ
jgi:hypothetical protein